MCTYIGVSTSSSINNLSCLSNCVVVHVSPVILSVDRKSTAPAFIRTTDVIMMIIIIILVIILPRVFLETCSLKFLVICILLFSFL